MSNLDDFFKKRDKKKKGTVAAKSKFSTLDTEQLAKNLEAVTVTQPDETDPDFQDAPAKERVTASENQDEEWKPFDSEENRDYTGLRINTQTWADDDEDNEQGADQDENAAKPAWVASAWGAKKGKETNSQEEEDEDREDKEEENTASQEPKSMAAIVTENKTNEAAEQAKAEPVASAASSTAPTPGAYIPPSMRARMAAEAASEAPKPAAAAPSSGGAYVPPSMRNRAPESSSTSAAGYEIPTSSVNYRRPNKSQPNFNDCLEFPSLDAASSDAPPAAPNDDRFELAKKSARVEPKNEKDNRVHTQNMFATLSNQ